MLVDSFDRTNYAPERSLETKMLQAKMDTQQRSFKSILQKNLTSDSSKPSLIQKNEVNNREFRQVKSSSSSDALINNNNPIDGNSKKIHIGTISDDTPTVSELLYNTKYKKKCWEMLENDVNSSKHFKRIPAGTDIFLDKTTSEIVWGKENTKKNLATEKQLKRGAVHAEKPDTEGSSIFSDTSSESSHYKSKSNFYKPTSEIYKSESQSKFKSALTETKLALNEAVREFMGKDYSKIDCYELVVNGLKNMGIKYSGKGGLGKHLIDKAIGEGRKQNHYLTGEGLVEATGQSVYNKRVISVNNPLSQAQSAMNEMENVLKEGQILSFSTRTRGHTGVISKKNGVWTFINSGYMDNNIAGKNGKKQVGEEILSKEIENWFKLAGKKKDGLTITLGDIDIMKLASYKSYKNGLSEKV
ncbi:MAG: hypothetical protein HQK73_12710 [Desulfamplus sp.]|nr:hypothetical protein [Desulfamplus sp.]